MGYFSFGFGLLTAFLKHTAFRMKSKSMAEPCAAAVGGPSDGLSHERSL